MAAARYDFIPNDEGSPFIEQGASFNVPLVWKDSNGVLVNMTGYTARMHVREAIDDPVILMELTTQNGRIAIDAPTGTIRLLLSATETAAITWVRGVYDLELVDPAGVVTRLLQGQLRVSKEVTR